jgi:hypothetical protein
MKFGSVSHINKHSVTAPTIRILQIRSIVITHVVQSKFECHAKNNYWFINRQISQNGELATHHGFIIIIKC